ncbi:two-component system histidine kinase PnpS [Paenibacillus sp. UNC499MF]|uniref:two-component system histidine kinase PnpS n=1 Tax=Paenibacillus sp. UNC499MF TaxID=1502751 RepID=UPI00089F8C1A|nr:ATP-binding protein [Paenibacillus sp. UNC499MF]SEG74082.1 two-component system, OmpR family, phosphate regulon sensor histidine kinase PhoR [Paenibacillus sp. UNC499MF]
MLKFRARLTLILMLMIGISMLIAGIFMAKLLEDSHIKELESNLVRELRVIEMTGDWNKAGDSAFLVPYYTSQTKRLKDFTDARVTYVREDGKVMGDSDENPEEMDNHAGRSEIQQAKRDGVGYAIRYSDTLKRNMLYAAIPVQTAGGEKSGYLRMAMSLEQVEKTIRHLWLFLLIGLGILFLIAGVTSYRIASGLTRPIENITNVAKQITNRNYKARVETKSLDEVGQLGQAINRMADSLHMQMNRILENEGRLKGVLENMGSGILMVDRDQRIVLVNRSAEDILGFSSNELYGKKYDEAKQQFELTRLIQECIETNEHIREEIIFYYPSERILEINLSPISQADGEWSGVLVVLHDITAMRRLERMRSEFVANVSHELKTPIAAVKGFSETLLAGALDDKETARSFLQIIFDESERLNRLVGDILELSKIESKRIPLQLSPTHLQSIIQKSLHMMEAEADKKKIALSMNVDEALFLEADEDRLRQILINLMANGINYTPEGGRVSVAAELAGSGADGEDERIRISVKDTGIGIPKKDLPRIFERFYRVDKARSRSSGGTGLGLSIVKHLVEMHHGTIRVESEVGYGTEFIIELPVIHP